MPANQSVKRGLALVEKDPSKVLGLVVGKHDVKPGAYIPKADAQSPPELSFQVPDLSKTYMVVALDIDAPFPSLDILGPILHWIQPGLKGVPGSSSLKITEPFVANYIGPAPPPGSAPHRYVFFLYEQPPKFEGKKYAPPEGKNLGNWNRMWYSLDAWEEKIELGPVLAVNFFKSN